MKISIRDNFPDVIAALEQLRVEVRNEALVSAVNKTMAKSKTNMIRAISREFNVSTGYVRQRLDVERAYFYKGRAIVESALSGSGKNAYRRSANLIAFMEKSVSLAQARKRAKMGNLDQLRFQIKRAGGRVVIPGAFIGNKGRTVFIREGKSRLPIRALQTIDIPQMFNARRINGVVVAAMLADFPAIFEHEAAFYLDRFNSRRASL